MYRLVEFIRRSYVTLLFLLLETAAVTVYMQSTPYTRARLLARFYSFTGGIASAEADVESYFSLARENGILTARVAALESEMATLKIQYENALTANAPNASQNMQPSQHDGGGLTAEPAEAWTAAARYMAARVVSNSINRTHNYLILNKGRADGVHEGMSVATPGGAVAGYVLECSEHYCAAMSILNTSFRSSGKIEGSEFSGSIEWQGLNPYEVTMSEVSKYADIAVGQRIVTTGFSSYFLPDMPIGVVESFEMDASDTFYTAVVRLEADMSSLHNVLIIENPSRNEINELEAHLPSL